MIKTVQDGDDLVYVAEDRSFNGQDTEALRIKGDTGEVTIGGKSVASLGVNTVIWAPFTAPIGGNYVTTWAEAVDAVAQMTGPNFIYLYGDPDEEDFVIPGGNWQLNNTTLVGMAESNGTDTDFRGYQELTYLYCEADANNPTWIKGCVGLKNIFFRATDYWPNSIDISGSSGSITAFDAETSLMTFVKGAEEGYDFKAQDIGKPLRIGDVSPWMSGGPADTGNNNGTFIIREFVDKNTVKVYNENGVAGDANNGSIWWDKCVSPFIVVENEEGTALEIMNTVFTLDNSDFRWGGNPNWGSLFLMGYNQEQGEDAQLSIMLTNGASVRWYSLAIDGELIIQSDGSGAWVGSLAFGGDGSVDVFPMAGTQVRTYQNNIDSWTLHQPYTVYIPADSSKWNGSPDSLTVHEALDELVARLALVE